MGGQTSRLSTFLSNQPMSSSNSIGGDPRGPMTPDEKQMICRNWPQLLRANPQLFVDIWMRAVERSPMMKAMFKIVGTEDPRGNAMFTRLTVAVEAFFHKLIVTYELDEDECRKLCYELGERHIHFAPRGFDASFWDIFMVSLLDTIHAAEWRLLGKDARQRMSICYAWQRFIQQVVQRMRDGFIAQVEMVAAGKKNLSDD